MEITAIKTHVYVVSLLDYCKQLAHDARSATERAVDSGLIPETNNESKRHAG